MKRKVSFAEAVNWEWIHAHHRREDGRAEPGPWLDRIMEHARANGFRGRITIKGAIREINRNLY